MPPTKKKEIKKFTIDCTAPADDEILDVANFEAFMLQRVKVDGKTGNLGDKVEIKADGNKLEVSAEAPFSKRYVFPQIFFLLKHGSKKERRTFSLQIGFPLSLFIACIVQVLSSFPYLSRVHRSQIMRGGLPRRRAQLFEKYFFIFSFWFSFPHS